MSTTFLTKPLHRLAFVSVLASTALLITKPAAARFEPARVAVEAPAVAARFADPTVAYDTPGFRDGRDDFTSHAELMAFVTELQARTGGFTLRIIGVSKEDRDPAVLRASSISPLHADTRHRLGYDRIGL